MWRWAAASAIGTAHSRCGSKLQDAYAVTYNLNNNCVFAAVSDGAGSARFGRYGAWITCRNLKMQFCNWLKNNEEMPDDETLNGWIDELRNRLSIIAGKRECSSRQFAATIAALLISQKTILAIQIGDSSIVGRRNSEWEVICWPENGEYAKTTFFVTDDIKPSLNIVRDDRKYDAFALFSDGVGDLALLQSNKSACSGFFRPIIVPVDSSNLNGRLSDVSKTLQKFLLGDSVCKNTDDDKTIILLSAAKS